MILVVYRFILISSSIILLLRRTSAANTMTPLFKRCSNSLKLNQSYKCIEINNYGCQAQRIPSGYFNHSRYHCSEDCPPTPEDIHVIDFKQARYINGKIYTGVNITWAVSLPNQGHTSNLSLEGFRLELKSKLERQIVSITVNLDKQPVDDNNKMRFWFDCFYPIRRNQTWEITVVRIPYNKELAENMMSKQFTIDSNGDLVDDSAVTPTRCTTTETQMSEMSGYPEISFVPEVSSSKEESNQWNSLYQIFEGIGVGIIIIILAICVGCLIKKSKAGYKKEALLLYDESSTEHVNWTEALISKLKRICNITLLSSSLHGDSINVEEMIKTADIIIIISSQQLVDMVSQLQHQNPFIKGAMACALKMLHKDGEVMSSKVLVVYFSEEKPFQVLQGLSIYYPLALPANLETVLRVVQNGRLAKLGPINTLDNLSAPLNELSVPSRPMNGDILHLQSTAILSTPLQDTSGIQENKYPPDQLTRSGNYMDWHRSYMYAQSYQKMKPNALPTFDCHYEHDAQLLNALDKSCHSCSQFCTRFKPPVDLSCIESDIDSYVDAINQY